MSYQINSFVGFVSLCCRWSCGNDCGRTCTECSPGHQFLGLTVEKALAKRAFIARQVFNGSFPAPLLKRVRFSTEFISFDYICCMKYNKLYAEIIKTKCKKLSTSPIFSFEISYNLFTTLISKMYTEKR